MAGAECHLLLFQRRPSIPFIQLWQLAKIGRQAQEICHNVSQEGLFRLCNSILSLDTIMYVYRSKTELEVYTGTYGQLELRHESGKTLPVYMISSSSSTEDVKVYIPAPMYFWKVINNPGAKETFAFIGKYPIYYS